MLGFLKMLLFDQIFGIATRKGETILKKLYLFEFPANYFAALTISNHKKWKFQ